MRNLAIVGLKLLGILGIYWSITGIAQVALSVSLAGVGAMRPQLWFFAAGWLISAIFAAALAVIMLARTDWVIAKLKFPEDPPASGMEPSQLLRVGFILVGVFAVLEALPAIGTAAYSVVAYNSGASRVMNPDYGRIISPLIKFILACILIGRSDRFAQSVFPAPSPAA